MIKYFSLNKPQIKSLQIYLKETPIKGCFRLPLNKFLEPKKKNTEQLIVSRISIFHPHLLFVLEKRFI